MTDTKNPSVIGFLLISLGAAFLLLQVIDLGSLFLFLPAIAFMTAGIAKRDQGLMVPGGILAGIGFGATIIELNWLPMVDEGALFMWAFALGWVSITVVSALFAEETATWALIPAAVMAAIGFAAADVLFFETALEVIAQYWPVLLILIGVGILFKSLLESRKAPSV